MACMHAEIDFCTLLRKSVVLIGACVFSFLSFLSLFIVFSRLMLLPYDHFYKHSDTLEICYSPMTNTCIHTLLDYLTCKWRSQFQHRISKYASTCARVFFSFEPHIKRARKRCTNHNIVYPIGIRNFQVKSIHVCACFMNLMNMLFELTMNEIGECFCVAV